MKIRQITAIILLISLFAVFSVSCSRNRSEKENDNTYDTLETTAETEEETTAEPVTTEEPCKHEWGEWIGIFIAIFSLAGASFGMVSAVLACVFWGLCITIFNLTFQAKVLSLVPIGTSVAMSMFSGIYNVGIGSGALIGGVVIQSLGIANISCIGAILAFCVCVYYKGWFLK